jgi:hypothetical protein
VCLSVVIVFLWAFSQVLFRLIFMGDGAALTRQRIGLIFLRVALSLRSNTDANPTLEAPGMACCLELGSFVLIQPDMFQVTMALARNKDDYAGWFHLKDSFDEIAAFNAKCMSGEP